MKIRARGKKADKGVSGSTRPFNPFTPIALWTDPFRFAEDRTSASLEVQPAESAVAIFLCLTEGQDSTKTKEDKNAKKGIFSFPLASFFDKALSLGTGQAPVKRYNEYLRDLIVNGRAKPSTIVSHHIQIDDAPQTYEQFDKRIEGYTKVLIL